MGLPEFPIFTERLELRPFEPSDLQALMAIFGPPEVSVYLYTDPLNETNALAALEKKTTPIPAFDADGQYLNLAAVLRETRELVGDVIFIYASHAHSQGEIGYVFRQDMHGRGLAVEAGAELLRLGFEDVGVHRIVGRCDARNAASARVLTKLGMRSEALLRENEFVKGEWTDELVFALLADEWRSR